MPGWSTISTSLAEGFAGVAVTVDGECFDAAAGEIRRLPREGTDPALAARSEREELASRLAQREQTEERAKNDLERAETALAEARGREEESQRALRDARRALDEAAEEASRTGWLAERQAEREGHGSGTGDPARQAGGGADRRAPSCRGRRASPREARSRSPGARAPDRAGAARRCPPWAVPATRFASLADRLERRAAKLAAGEGEDGGDVAAELRECSQQEFGLQARAAGGERGDDRGGGRGHPAARPSRRELGELQRARQRPRRGAGRRDGGRSRTRTARGSRPSSTGWSATASRSARSTRWPSGSTPRRASTSPSWPSSARTWRRRSPSCAR